jgi:hypothetical protein
VAVGVAGALVGVADGKAEEVAEGRAEEVAKGANVAVGVGVGAVPKPAINDPTHIKSRTRAVNLRSMRHLLAAAAQRAQRTNLLRPTDPLRVA